VLWSLALLREHNGRWAQLCARQLAGLLDAHARTQEERAQQRQQRQREQQQERQQTAAAAGVATGVAVDGAAEADAAQQGARQQKLPPEFVRQLRQVAAVLLAAQAERLESPLVSALSPDVRAAALDAWRSHIARKSTKRPGRCACVSACVRTCVRTCVRARVCARACVCACVCMCSCVCVWLCVWSFAFSGQARVFRALPA
jgi:hypothetical protein